MCGYWERPDLNEKAFFSQQIFSDYENVYYRTGDLVQLRPDGIYDFLGRKAHQVKVRGYRVELAEVDNVVASHAAVEEGASYTIKSDSGDSIQVAIILSEGKTVSKEDIIAFMVERLPDYAVPQDIVFLKTFPRTGTGKVDRRALTALAIDRST